MRHDEERDNTTAIEATIIKADNATWSECECEACTEFSEAEAEYIRDSRHIRLVKSSVGEALLGQRHFGG
jgi:hypothetical protein